MKPMRYEYKYLVASDKLEEFRNAISPFFRVDEYAEGRTKQEYTVRSIYYDSPNLDDYRDKIEGLKIRKKLRVRAYNEAKPDNLVFLEVKRKYENHISKNRAPLLYVNLEEVLTRIDYTDLLLKKRGYLTTEDDAAKFFFHYRNKFSIPVVLVVYDREAYFSKFDSTLRITFDKNLRSLPFPTVDDIYNDASLKSAMHGYFVLEIKFYHGYPTWLRKIVGNFGFQRKAVSKYTICSENHDEIKMFIENKKLLLSDPNIRIGSNYRKDFVKNAG
ncbi:MAG: polyphosphate polymerase domain-containing protein [Ignavibacteriales bacterium]|nr:MAG: polyphosphate polymerase domain-containing protein [Ignavibacteriales bacterium]